MIDNLDSISKIKMIVGTVIKNLKSVDCSDDKWSFSDGDYDLLKQITNIRNYWAHQAYCDFINSTN